MLADRIEGKWIEAFCEVLTGCAVKHGDIVAILSETQSRALNVQLAELALSRLGARPFHVVVPTPANRHPVAVRSTGASEAIGSLTPVVAALGACALVVDCTLEGLMHAPETPDILRAGARILVISNEHPEALERMRPDAVLEGRVRAAAKMLREGSRMHVASAAGTKLDIDLEGARTVGIWGWTQRPGTLVLDRGDVNLTFKRYLEAPVTLTLKADYITRIEGEGADAEMMRGYLAAWGERDAYAVSHVGFGLNPKARYEALAMYDRRDTNGTEIRAVAGNFLFSTGANEFAGRYTAGHFDIPVMKTTIKIDNTVVVRDGALQDVFGS